MVKEQVSEKKTYYLCEECAFAYRNQELAQQCEDWCKKYNSCNLDITKHAIKL